MLSEDEIDRYASKALVIKNADTKTRSRYRGLTRLMTTSDLYYHGHWFSQTLVDEARNTLEVYVEKRK